MPHTESTESTEEQKRKRCGGGAEGRGGERRGRGRAVSEPGSGGGGGGGGGRERRGSERSMSERGSGRGGGWGLRPVRLALALAPDQLVAVRLRGMLAPRPAEVLTCPLAPPSTDGWPGLEEALRELAGELG